MYDVKPVWRGTQKYVTSFSDTAENSEIGNVQ